MKPILNIENLTKIYGNVPSQTKALNGITFQVMPGEFLGIMGSSGSGKSTLLNCIATVIQPTGGSIQVEGDTLQSLKGKALAEYRGKKVGYLFQNFELLDNLTGRENILLPTSLHGVSEAESSQRLKQLADYLEITDVLDKFPSKMSGGQRQRVAIARALVNEPRVLLLDEPLGALDLKLREQMQFELKKLQQELGITFIFVTHDQGEALSMSDRVAVFNNGRIEQVDTPRDLYMRPRTPFVAGFVGTSNVFDAGLAQTLCGMEGTFSLRPEHIRLNEQGDVQVQGVVQAVQYQGAATRLELKLADGAKLLVSQANFSDASPLSGIAPGQAVMASWSREAMIRLHEER